MGPSVTKVNDFLLSFVADSFDLVVVLDATLDINCVYMYFVILCSLFIKFLCKNRICKYDLGKLILLQNKSNNNSSNNNNNNNNNNEI